MGTSKTEEQRYQAVLVGTGMVAGTHLAALAAARNQIDLRGVCARTSQSARQFCEKAEALLGHDVRIYDDAKAIARDPAVDFVIIATPPNARASLIRPLAEAGKHILLEKPVARTSRQAEEIVALCENAGITLGVVFQHRLRAASRQAARMIASGDLGALGLVEIAVPWWREQSYYDEPGRGTYARDGGGVLISQAIHSIDLALSLAGPVISVQAMAATTRFHRMEAEDFVSAGLRFENGAVGSLLASTASFPGAPETITLHFDKASLKLVSGQLQVSWRDGCEQIIGAETASGGSADPMAFSHEGHQAVIEDFADALSRRRLPLASGRDALSAHALIDAIVISSRDGRRIDIDPDQPITEAPA